MLIFWQSDSQNLAWDIWIECNPCDGSKDWTVYINDQVILTHISRREEMEYFSGRFKSCDDKFFWTLSRKGVESENIDEHRN